MKGDKFEIGDAVRVSAAHLRFICPLAAKGWPTTRDPGKMKVIAVYPCGIFDLVVSWSYDWSVPRTYNSNNLIRATPREVYNEAMRAEHSPRNYRSV